MHVRSCINSAALAVLSLEAGKASKDMYLSTYARQNPEFDRWRRRINKWPEMRPYAT